MKPFPVSTLFRLQMFNKSHLFNSSEQTHLFVR
nr:MAG TPA: hypothetical protein [Caudoviricetes sp.]